MILPSSRNRAPPPGTTRRVSPSDALAASPRLSRASVSSDMAAVGDRRIAVASSGSLELMREAAKIVELAAGQRGVHVLHAGIEAAHEIRQDAGDDRLVGINGAKRFFGLLRRGSRLVL